VETKNLTTGTAWKFIILLGIISLFSDMTHEGARTITGPFLGILGAGALVISTVAGLGEFLGYAVRFLSGSLADRTKRYWPITYVGYGLQMFSVPALALAGGWEIAAVLISAELGRGNQGVNYVLRKFPDQKQRWLERIFGSWLERIFIKKTPAFTLRIANRDEMGARALGELKGRGINLVANALAQSVDHIINFFNLFRTEIAFYVGCLNLHDHLAKKGEPMCFPLPIGPGERRERFKGLYDVCLALSLKQRVVGNEMEADDKDLVIITGANQGGKSTFLRSLGLAQLMMQCGMFAPAESFSANICDGLFTHYKREEDVTMSSGKLDEELSRMSDIVDHVRANSLLLFNESFAATNEREGSEIAGQIICALLEKRIKIFFVTHLYELAYSFYEKQMENAIFLRAERRADGGRTFKIIKGAPLETSYGKDLYNNIFGPDN
jgi:DNA mismatch repair ATPase MutS